MTDKVKRIIKWSGIGAIILGVISIYLGGGVDSKIMEAVGAIFVSIGLITDIIRK